MARVGDLEGLTGPDGALLREWEDALEFGERPGGRSFDSAPFPWREAALLVLVVVFYVLAANLKLIPVDFVPVLNAVGAMVAMAMACKTMAN